MDQISQHQLEMLDYLMQAMKRSPGGCNLHVVEEGDTVATVAMFPEMILAMDLAIALLKVELYRKGNL